MILGVGTDNQLHIRVNVSRWIPVPSSGTMMAVAMMPDGTILGVGTDNRLHTRATLTSSWLPVPGSRDIVGVTVMLDGTIVGVGERDRQLYTSTTLTSPWVKARNSATLMMAVTTMPDGTLLGVGTDNGLHTRATLASEWVPVRWSETMMGATVLPNGIIVGVGTDNQLHTRDGLDGWWLPVPNSDTLMMAVTTMPDGSLLGVGTDNKLHWLASLPDNWQRLGSRFTLMGVTGLPDGSLLGLGMDNKLYTCSDFGDPWKLVQNSGTMMRAVGMMPDGTILGVGKVDGQLYTRATLTSPWVKAQNSATLMMAVTTMPDGTLLGVGTDNQLHTRATLVSEWVPESKSSAMMMGVTALPDGTIVGVGTDNQLHTRTTLTSPWVTVPNSGTMMAVGVRPGYSTPPSAATWLLQFTSRNPAAADGDGRPWGDGTAMAARASRGQVPWDSGCLVTPLLGGFATMNAIRDAFEAAIADANAQASQSVAPGERGHVYIADWLLNGLRDLSEANPWRGEPWDPATTVAMDQTALGLLVRMMAAGINVRVLLWMPTTLQASPVGGYRQHADEHWSIAAAIQDYNDTLQKAWKIDQPIGVVALDLRTARPTSAALHQKMVAVRVGAVNVAFCGGVDLAFTRRDFGQAANQVIGIGDWQSGDRSPLPSAGWPKQSPPPTGGYPAFPFTDGGRFPEDLSANVYGQENRYWHDHHLKLEGPVVASLEEQFAERWIIDSNVYLFDRTSSIGSDNQVQLTSRQAFANGAVLGLPAVQPCPPAGDAVIQVWRTIPLRQERRVAPFVRGEFTVMAGIANAISEATSLITIWDQYFWSVPLAKLLAARLNATPTLRLLIVLPPYGTAYVASEMKMRKNAMQALWTDLDAQARTRVLAMDMWAAQPDIGVYVHAKVQTYDDALLVCGSANLSRRSLECDAELDCAVLHQPTLRRHLANLYACVTGDVWTDFSRWADYYSPNAWLRRYWDAIRANHSRALINDPFFTATIGTLETPNHVPIPYNGWIPAQTMEPTSIGSAADSSKCQYSECSGDPGKPGRLDEITFLLERCHQGNTWPWRVPNTSPAIADATETGAEIPRLTL